MISLFVLLVAASSAYSQKEYELLYKIGSAEGLFRMKVQVDAHAQQVTFHMAGNSMFEDVATLEDYGSELAASRVEGQESCFVRRLTKSFEDQISFLERKTGVPMDVKKDVKIEAILMDAPEEEVSQTIFNFCEGLSIYKLVSRVTDEESSEESDESDESSEESNESSEESEESYEDSEESDESSEESNESSSSEKLTDMDTLPDSPQRQVYVTFTRCCMFNCIPYCYSTVLTIPTGTTVVYYWWWCG